jgi:hypothetical protein
MKPLTIKVVSVETIFILSEVTVSSFSKSSLLVNILTTRGTAATLIYDVSRGSE